MIHDIPILRSALLASTTLLLLMQQSNTCDAFSATATKLSKPILLASEENSAVQFDTACVANPVVVPPDEFFDEWQCYYYGNNGTWNHGHKPFLPNGSSGLAVSNDGITWTKIAGSEKDGAVLSPSDSGWDSVHVGANEVFRVSENEMHMYYFGASDEEVSLGPMNLVGLRIRIGRAKSTDNGRTWKKDENFVLDYDDSEGFFASWPRIIRFEDGRPWEMTYHSFTSSMKWRVFGAESADQGNTWTRTGLLLEGDESEDAYDFKGVGTRAVIRRGEDLLMIHEGVSSDDVHRLGAAINKRGNSNEWTKLNNGKPILEPNQAPFGDWSNNCVGTPFLVDMPDGSLRLYHCGKKPGVEEKMAIGVIESKSGDFLPGSWTALP